MPQVHTDELQAIRGDIQDLVKNTAELLGKFEMHIQNQAIHQNPPCEAHKALSGKLWGIGVGLVTALLGVAYNAFKGH